MWESSRLVALSSLGVGLRVLVSSLLDQCFLVESRAFPIFFEGVAKPTLDAVCAERPFPEPERYFGV